MVTIQSLNQAAKTPPLVALLMDAGKTLAPVKPYEDLPGVLAQFPEFKGEMEDQLLWRSSPKKGVASRVLILGIGDAAELDAEKCRCVAAAAVKRAISLDLDHIAIFMPAVKTLPLNAKAVVGALTEGAVLGNHRFSRYQEDKKKPLKKIILWASAQTAKRLKGYVRQVEKICQGTLLAREWVSVPANDKRPEVLAIEMVQQAKVAGLGAFCRGKTWLKRSKMGGILAVNQGSSQEPRLVVLHHKPKQSRKKIVLVGKGVTFDTGGYNLKPTGSIETMKVDMGGGAAVAATLITAAKTKLSHEVIGIIPLVENMVSGTAVRPGDIITMGNGKRVEINNTDAEGRLILADALAWGIKTYQPDMVIDLATLTGACLVALGSDIAGLFTHDEAMGQALVAAAKATFERVWPLPLPDEYKKLLKSPVADLSNIGKNRWGGAITAALFLSAFVETPKWAHIDIAGPAYTAKDTAYCKSGGTGFGVRLLMHFMESVA